VELKPSEIEAQIKMLHAELRREREVSAAERQRAALWEEACKRSYRFALTPRSTERTDESH
jgi:hypothetical protein